MTRPVSGTDAFSRLVACSRLVGQRFCDALVEALAETLSLPTILIARFHPDRPGWVRTVSAWSNGALVPAFEYELSGSPCSEVMAGGTCHFADNVAVQFPRDALLADMGARGYVGTALSNHEGRAVGVLAAFSDKPIEISPEHLSLFEIFASRAAAELEREASISRSEYLGRLVDGSASEIYVFDAVTMRFLLVNGGARDNLGYAMTELEQMSPLDLKPDMTQDDFQAVIEPLRSGREPLVSFRTRHRRKDGSTYPVEVRLQQISKSGDPVYFAAIEDISRRAAVEQRLDEAKGRLQRLFAQSPAGIIETDPTGRMTLVNPTLASMLDYSEADLLDRTIFDLTHPDSMPQTLSAVAQLKAGADGLLVEKNYVRKDGQTIAALSNVSALRSESGDFLGVAAVITDVTQRLEAEERVRDSEARLRKILDGTLAFVGVLDPDGTLLEANAPALAAADLSRGDVVGRKFWDCYWWSHSPAVMARLQDAVARTAAGQIVRYDEEIRVGDDGRLTIDFMLTPYIADDGRIEFLVPSGVDITDRKRQEGMLRNLMREVNHRSKNLLSVVQAIARQMPTTSPADFRREFGLRLQSLAACQDILVNTGWQNVPLSRLIRAQLAHFENLIGNRISLSGPDLNIAPATTQAFSMAVYELATNATKYGALSNDKGTVDIRWHLTHADPAPRFHLHWQERGGPVVEPPTDTGFGSKVLNHVVAGMMDGTCTSSYGPDGFEWRIECDHTTLLRS